MTESEAREKIEMYVYCDLTLGALMHECSRVGIQIYDKNGKYRKRTDMETDLIDILVSRIVNGGGNV